MCIHSLLKNKNYILSKRNYLNDYNYLNKKEIDMTLSGSYLVNKTKLDLNDFNLDKYPEKASVKKFKNSIKAKNQIKDDFEIIIGPGSNGIIQNIIKICFKKSGNLVTPYYSFDQTEYGCTSYNSITKRVYMNDDGTINYENIDKSIDKKTRLIYICNPNNITGIYEDNKKIIELAKKHSPKLFLIDEAGIEYTKEKSIFSNNLPNNIIIVRTLSKAYGLSNLRIGYLICNKDFSKLYKENITINEVSGLSLYIANKIYNNTNITENINEIISEKNKIIDALKSINIKTYNSKSNVILTINTPDILDKIIKENNISLLKIYDQNKKYHYRIAIQNKEINKKFIEALGEYNETNRF